MSNCAVLLRKARNLVNNRRNAAVAALDNWQDLRDRAEVVKTDVLSNLADHLENFERVASEHGNACALGEQCRRSQRHRDKDRPGLGCPACRKEQVDGERRNRSQRCSATRGSHAG